MKGPDFFHRSTIMTTATHTDTANWLSDAHAALKAVEALYGEALASVLARAKQWTTSCRRS